LANPHDLWNDGSQGVGVRHRVLAVAAIGSAIRDGDLRFSTARSADSVLWCQTAGLSPDLVRAALCR